MSLVAVRVTLFYIHSYQECDFCNAFIKSDEYKKLQSIGTLISGINVIYRDCPCDWAEHPEFYLDDDVNSMIERELDRNKVIEIKKRYKTWSADIYLRNYMKAIGYNINHFPSILIEFFYSGLPPKLRKIEGFAAETEGEESIVDIVKSIILEENSGLNTSDMEERIKHPKALLPGSAYLRARLKKEEKKFFQ
ncbi:MAG: hypothetical protein ACP6IY_21220 [Promethearchaeia archaeon]